MLIRKNVSLKPYTTFMTEANARYFCEINNEEDIYELFTTPEWKENARLILGAGSNTLIVDDVPGIVVHFATTGRKIIREHDESVTIKVAAGELWHDFVMDTVNQGYWGIENLALIPGTVGAAAVQNIGAYGVEAKDTITSVEVINLKTYERETFDNQSCHFAYRNSIFKQQPEDYLVISVTLTLSKKPNPQLTYGAIQQLLEESGATEPGLMDIANAVMTIRQSKLPAVGEIGMAGSFFKNPVISAFYAKELKKRYPDMVMFQTPGENVKISAGWLIEFLGYKGFREGNVGTYYKHSLVLVNYGKAHGREVWEFAQKIMKEVEANFGIVLEPEVLIIQHPTP